MPNSTSNAEQIDHWTASDHAHVLCHEPAGTGENLKPETCDQPYVKLETTLPH